MKVTLTSNGPVYSYLGEIAQTEAYLAKKPGYQPPQYFTPEHNAALEASFGFRPGTVLRLYQTHLVAAAQHAVESNVSAVWMAEMRENQAAWEARQRPAKLRAMEKLREEERREEERWAGRAVVSGRGTRRGKGGKTERRKTKGGEGLSGGATGKGSVSSRTRARLGGRKKGV